MAKAPAIGIDLGTTYSCVAVFRDGKVQIIPNDQGKRITPSYVAFTDTERLIGDAAKNQLAMNPTNTIFGTKRLIGRNFEDPSVQSDMKHWPFQVVNDGGKPKLEAKYKAEKKTFLPEQICSMVLAKMKETAEEYLGKKVTDAVITVPACFNDIQCQATRDAATIAGFTALKIIGASAAAAMAYVLDKNADKRNILIFDLGGCNCNVSIVTIQDGTINFLHTSGDPHLGGDDLDNRMVDHFVQEFERKFEKDLTTNKRALHRLRTACERAKRALSSSTQASIEIESLFGEIDLSTSITRARFENINADLFRATVDLVEKCLSDAKMDKAQIHDIVLVGGSSRIPKVQKLLRDFFNGKELNTSMNPDEVLAYGASIEAAIIQGDKSKELQNLRLCNVTPFSLGIETAGGAMTVLIKRNTAIPIKQTQTFEIPVGIIQVYAGESALTKDNRLWGSIDLTGILPGFRGVSEVEVTVDIDATGFVNVTAIEKSSGEKGKSMVNGQGGLSKKEIVRLVKEAEKYRTDDEKEKDRVSAKNSLESYWFNMKTTLEDVLNKGNDIVRWLDANPLAKKEEFEKKRQELEQACNLIIREMHGGVAPPNSAAGYSGTPAKRSRLSHH